MWLVEYAAVFTTSNFENDCNESNGDKRGIDDDIAVVVDDDDVGGQFVSTQLSTLCLN